MILLVTYWTLLIKAKRCLSCVSVCVCVCMQHDLHMYVSLWHLFASAVPWKWCFMARISGLFVKKAVFKYLVCRASHQYLRNRSLRLHLKWITLSLCLFKNNKSLFFWGMCLEGVRASSSFFFYSFPTSPSLALMRTLVFIIAKTTFVDCWFVCLAGGHQDYWQDPAGCCQPGEDLQGGPDHEDAGPSSHHQAVPGEPLAAALQASSLMFYRCVSVRSGQK